MKSAVDVNCDRILLHFDYDCFYASVVEAEKPHLKLVPLAIQQKQIVVTCNYAARSKGVYKLQLITEAKKACPGLVIVLGEDLTKFRDASKELFAFVSSFVWSRRSERLGMDEVWLDVSDIVDFNVDLLGSSQMAESFFRLDKVVEKSGFQFDASKLAGRTFPPDKPEELNCSCQSCQKLYLRLLLASHLALYIRNRLQDEKGYAATVGISVNKMLSKLVGNVHKPCNHTTLLPPYHALPDGSSNVSDFLDAHDIGKLPGIGFKSGQAIREFILGREAAFSGGLVYGWTQENVTVGDVRRHPLIDAPALERILSARSGATKGLGERVWKLLNGDDEVVVARTRLVPKQISIEDSYLRLDNMKSVKQELYTLSLSLVRRLHIDLTENDSGKRKWIAIPQTVRLSTRPKADIGADGKRSRSFARSSRSGQMPTFVITGDDLKETAVKLSNLCLLPMFEDLHPRSSTWNISLINVGATGIRELAPQGDSSYQSIAGFFSPIKKSPQLNHDEAMEDVKEELQRNRLLVDRITENSQTFRLTGSEDLMISSQTSFAEDDNPPPG